jgi:hypothetical protein
LKLPKWHKNAGAGTEENLPGIFVGCTSPCMEFSENTEIIQTSIGGA